MSRKEEVLALSDRVLAVITFLQQHKSFFKLTQLAVPTSLPADDTRDAMEARNAFHHALQKFIGSLDSRAEAVVAFPQDARNMQLSVEQAKNIRASITTLRNILNGTRAQFLNGSELVAVQHAWLQQQELQEKNAQSSQPMWSATAEPSSPAQLKCPWTFTIPEATWNALKQYKKDVTTNPQKLGQHLSTQFLRNRKKISALTDLEFLQELLNTKKSKAFAEQELMSTSNPGWNTTELSILANIGTVITTFVGNDGTWNSNPRVKPNDFVQNKATFQDVCSDPSSKTMMMGYVSGPLLKKGSPDYNSIVLSEQKKEPCFNQTVYEHMIEMRLMPVLFEMNRQAQAQDKHLSITMPGLGCGEFAGDFADTIRENFHCAIKNILTKYADQLTHIFSVDLDVWDSIGLSSASIAPETLGSDSTKHKISYFCFASTSRLWDRVSSSRVRPQLAPFPTSLIPDSLKDKIMSGTIVAADLLSWMSNDGWIDSRHTDEGVKGMSTTTMVQIAMALLPLAVKETLTFRYFAAKYPNSNTGDLQKDYRERGGQWQCFQDDKILSWKAVAELAQLGYAHTTVDSKTPCHICELKLLQTLAARHDGRVSGAAFFPPANTPLQEGQHVGQAPKPSA